jgi:hypothetical protein
VKGQDLLSLGYPSGPMFKEVFDAILERRFAGELRSKAEEIDFVLSRFPKPR